MTENITRSGQCSCGAVQYKTVGDPIRVFACHCKQCQLRTGSAFGIGCFFLNQKFTLLQGSLKVYERSSDSKRKIQFHFCDKCGTTVLWNAEAFPTATGIAGGTFDDTAWLSPDSHVWTRYSQKWVSFPDDVDIFSESSIGK